MQTLLNQIEQSLNSEVYYLSLFGALAVPDIAGALESENGEATGKKYVSWYDKWVRPRSNEELLSRLPPELRTNLEDTQGPLTGDACYKFRCSILHQGSSQHPDSPFSRIIFVEPGTTTNRIHNTIINDVLCIDLVWFCREMIAGGRLWLEQIEEDECFIRNYERFAKRHPEGLHPIIAGVPVIG